MRYALYSILSFLLLVSLVSAQCTVPADQEPCDDIISITELTAYINIWYSCSSCAPDLLAAITAYYNPACSNDAGCSSAGSFCDGNTPYSCSMGVDGCLDRSNGIPCDAGYFCSGGDCTSSPYVWENGPSSDPEFFPIGVWLQEPANIDEFRNIGINTFIGLWAGPTESQLSTLKSKSMPAIANQNAVGLTSQNNDVIQGWLEMDEPDNAQWNATKGGYDPCISPLVVQQMYNNLKSNDSSRPVYLNFGLGVAREYWSGRGACAGNLSMYPEYIRGADIISFDIYPVTNGWPISDVAKGVERLANWSNGTKIVWNIIGTTHINNATTRPTAEQIKSMVWMSIIHGSMGITYFVHEWQPSFREDGIFRYPEIVSGVTQINGRITSLAPVLNSPTIKGGLSAVSNDSSVTIKTMLKMYNGSAYLFAIAMGNKYVKANFSISDISTGAAEVIDEGRTIPVLNNKFQDRFKAYEVHIYKIGESSAIDCLPSNNCFYVSVTGAGSRDGTIGNEMSLTDVINYANARTNEALTFSLESGNYGNLSFINMPERGANSWVTFKAAEGETPVFLKASISNSNRRNSYLKLEGLTFQHPQPNPMPTVNGYRHTTALGNILTIYRANKVEINDCILRGYDKYISQNAFWVEEANDVTLNGNDASNTASGFQVKLSNNTKILNNYLHDVSEGSGIRIVEGCSYTLIEGNHVYVQDGGLEDAYFPYDDPSEWHVGSGISIRSENMIIRNNTVHSGYSQALMFYSDGLSSYDNMLLENNLFYDTGRVALYNCGKNVSIRHNTFIGAVGVEGAGQTRVIQRYTGSWAALNIYIASGYNSSGITVSNNLQITPPVQYLPNKNNNFIWTSETAYLGTNDYREIWIDPSNVLHGNPNIFENVGFIWTTPEYNYTRDGIKPFFANAGLYTRNIEWSPGTTYSPSYAGDPVRYRPNGKYYQSLQVNNLDHSPPDSPTWWQENNSLSFWEKDRKRTDLDYHPLMNSEICDGSMPSSVTGEAWAGALPCVCTQNSQCQEVFGAGSVCNSQTRECEG